MNQSDTLNEIRKRIDKLDEGILTLLKERANIALEVKQAKKDGFIYKPGREAEIMSRVCKLNDSQLPNTAVVSIFKEIVGACRNLEQSLKVAYLGPEGTYSHEAAVKLFGSTSEFIPEISLHEATRAVEGGTADVALLPFENSSEGGVTETHKLLLDTRLHIIAEYTMQISHELLSHAASLSDIRTVHAHPQALGQCREWLQHHLPQATLVNEVSNSQAAALAAKESQSAAIAGKQAAEIYQLPIVVSGINDIPDNTTRFIALSKLEAEPTGHDKTSVVCTVKDKPGALHELLGIFAAHNVSLTRLESQPHPDHHYAFYIDFTGHVREPEIAATIAELMDAAKSCKVLGSYPEG